VTSRTVPEVCAECGGDMEVADTERDPDTGKFHEEWYCPACDQFGTVEGNEELPPRTYSAAGCCRD
jgi:hypothetical protein